MTVREVNAPPTLASITDQSARAGQLLTVPLDAADSDVPANELTFELVQAPSGAAIDPPLGCSNRARMADARRGDHRGGKHANRRRFDQRGATAAVLPRHPIAMTGGGATDRERWRRLTRTTGDSEHAETRPRRAISGCALTGTFVRVFGVFGGPFSVNWSHISTIDN